MCPGGASGGNEDAGALTPQAVGPGVVGAARVEDRRQIGELVHHHLGMGGAHRLLHRGRIEDVADDGIDAHPLQRPRLLRGAGHAGHLMTGGAQARRERPADGTRDPGDEDPHRRGCQ